MRGSPAGCATHPRQNCPLPTSKSTSNLQPWQWYPITWPNMDPHNREQRGHVQRPANSTAYPNQSSVEPSARALESRPKAVWTAESSPKETFACQQCSKAFNRRENLSRHVKTRKSSRSLITIFHTPKRHEGAAIQRFLEIN
jgi:hypothetical protein